MSWRFHLKQQQCDESEDEHGGPVQLPVNFKRFALTWPWRHQWQKQPGKQRICWINTKMVEHQVKQDSPKLVCYGNMEYWLLCITFFELRVAPHQSMVEEYRCFRTSWRLFWLVAYQTAISFEKEKSEWAKIPMTKGPLLQSFTQNIAILRVCEMHSRKMSRFVQLVVWSLRSSSHPLHCAEKNLLKGRRDRDQLFRFFSLNLKFISFLISAETKHTHTQEFKRRSNDLKEGCLSASRWAVKARLRLHDVIMGVVILSQGGGCYYASTLAMPRCYHGRGGVVILLSWAVGLLSSMTMCPQQPHRVLSNYCEGV